MSFSDSNKLNRGLSLVIPVYNEESLVESAVEKTVSQLSANFTDFEIILVDDGSRDGTAIIMDRLAEKHPQVRVLHNLVNLNVGASVQRGLLFATKDYVTHSAIDLPLEGGDLKKLTLEMGDADLLVINRTSYAGYSFWRVICSQINRFLLRVLFGTGFRDLNFSQIYKKSIIPKIIPLAKSPAFTTPEMVIRAQKMGFKVKGTDCVYHPRSSGVGAFGKFHDIFWSMYDMFRFRFVLKKNLRDR